MNCLTTCSLNLDNSRFRLGALAGLAGGAAEVAWILLYSSLGDTQGTAVAQGVTATFSSAVADSPASAALGVAIHMMLSVLLGMAVAVAAQALLLRSRSALLEPCFVVVSLIAVWAFNFFVLLPVINPEFVHLLPLGVTLASKVSFGVAAALVMSAASTRRSQVRL